jgi:ribosomal protein S18 acetylase RimI-like enzyme
MHFRPILPRDRSPLVDMLERIDVFNREEKAVAAELIDESLRHPGPDGYRCIVALEPAAGEEVCLGYVCFGKTPMTEHTYDMYWIAVEPSRHGAGIGGRLLQEMIEAVLADRGTGIRVETSSTDAYGGTLRFYLNQGFRVACRIPDFYRKGDDLVILFRNIP